MNRSLIRLSKFMSLVLRHKPESVGLTLDPAGWVNINELLQAARRANLPQFLLDEATLHKIVAQNDKQRFSISADGRHIRANHGHSLPVNLGLTPTAPPPQLFHGTATRFLPSIKQQGLIAKNRQYVHLSVDEPTARQVGRRHGQPIILTIEAGRMTEAGLLFYHSASNIWLTNHVPLDYLNIPE